MKCEPSEVRHLVASELAFSHSLTSLMILAFLARLPKLLTGSMSVGYGYSRCDYFTGAASPTR